MKNKGLIITNIVLIVVITGVLGYGIFSVNTSHKAFADSGYILMSPDTTYTDDDINTQVYFEKGTSYKKVYPDKIEFTDQKNNKQFVDNNSFIHYNDGSIGSLAKGVMIDLDKLDIPVINYYGFSTESILEKTGDNLVLDNRGNAMNFKDILWKISDSKYLLVSKNIGITFSEDNEHMFKDYIEINYYDTGIIRIITDEGTWQTVSSECNVSLDNGVSLNLYNRTIVKDKEVKLSLKQMVVDSDENISIVPEDVKTKVIKAPEFDIQSVDGINGVSGKEGEAGEAGDAGEAGEDGSKGDPGEEGTVGNEGEIGTNGQSGDAGANGTEGVAGNPGEPGTTGTTGVNGINGQNGSSGANGAAGSNGAKGEKGVSGDEAALPDNSGDNNSENEEEVSLPKFEIKDLQAKTNSVSASIAVSDEENRLDPAKTFTAQIVENNTGKQVYTTEIDSSNREFIVEYNGLMSNKEYRLLISADYIVDNVNYNNIFINKLFFTDSLGLTVDKSYATDTSLAFKVMSKDYCEVEAADLQLLDSKGEAVRTSEIHMVLTKESTGDVLVFDNLSSNTQYQVKLVNIQMSYDTSLVAPPEIQAVEYKTLKKAPVLGNPIVLVNKRNSCFEFSLDSVNDKDGAIKNFRYEVYEVGFNSSQVLVKTLFNTANDVVPCYIDDIKIKRNYNYRLRIVAECYDNEKEVEYASTYTEIFSMKGDDFPIVLFEKNEDETHHDDIAGSVQINTNGAKVTIDDNNPLMIELKNTKGDIDNIFIKEIAQWQLLDVNKYLYTFPIKKNDLLADDNYVISVYGTVDLNDGTGARKNSLIGSVVTRTDKPNGFTAKLKQDSNLTSSISFHLNLSDVSDTVSSSYESGTMKYLEVNLYNGGTEAAKTEPPVATYTIEGTDKDPLADKVYGANSILLTEKDFNISTSAITSSMYTVEISSVRDYTRYGNEFAVNNNIQTFSKQATLPDLNSINKNDGLLVTPITLANIKQYVSAADFAKYQAYDTDIVFGYKVSAAYFDNSAGLVSSFIYYAFDENDYKNAASVSDLYTNIKPVATIEENVPEIGTVPSAVFLFGTNEAVNMSRGSKFVFTYRAKLKQADASGNVAFFPETVDPTVVIRSKTANAPYQRPKFYFYPWNSDNSSVTWKYYINAPDIQAVPGNFTASKGTLAVAKPILNTYDSLSNPVEVKINDLNRNDIYTLKMSTLQYKPSYNLTDDNILVSQYFESEYDLSTSTTSLTYGMEDIPTQNRYRITVYDDPQNKNQHLSRVTALKVRVYKDKNDYNFPLKEITVPLDYILDNCGVGYLRYGELQQFLPSSTLYYTVTAIYDTGNSGFMNSENTISAIQELPTNEKGHYLTLNSTNTALFESSTSDAKGSYFNILTMDNKTSTINFNYKSALESTFSGVLNLITDSNGARTKAINTQPYITLKKLKGVPLHIKDQAITELYSEFPFTSITPSINLNRGEAYTIDTTISSATVHWELEGQDEKLKQGDIKDSKMYFDLYKINELGIKELIGSPIATDIKEKVYQYDTQISDLASNTKYGVQLYYIDSNTGNKVYPINSYHPEKEPSTNIYVFTTNSTIVITPDAVPVKYVANSYLDKYLQISYGLNQTLGFDIQYSICKKEASVYHEVLSPLELAARGIISTPLVNKEVMSNEKLILSPGKLYWKDELGNTVYFPFNSTEYYLCITPVSETNSNVTLGNPVYVQLNVSPLNTPFCNIKCVPDDKAVSFQISIIDLGKVMVNGHFKVKVLNGSGADITPQANKNATYSITSPLSIKVSNIPQGDKAVIKIYTVYDMLNTGLASDGTVLSDIENIPYESLDAEGKYYLKFSHTGYPLGTSGYDLGEIQISQCSSEHARVYFTNSVNISKVKYIRYVIVNSDGVSYSYNEIFTPTIVNSTNCYYELSHKFTTTGIYQIQLRFYDEAKNQMDDVPLTYFKSY